MVYLFVIRTEKGSELPAGDPGRTYKGRAVLSGDRVVAQNYGAAILQGLGSSPHPWQPPAAPAPRRLAYQPATNHMLGAALTQLRGR